MDLVVAGKGSPTMAWLKSVRTRPGRPTAFGFCRASVNSDTLTVYYGVKQNQFTKLTPEPRASDLEEFNEAFDRAIKGWLL